MCGVLGLSNGVDAKRLILAIGALAHRGPDATGIARVTGGVTLAHRRLSIIDVGKRSNQPFVYGSTTISYNGELWNFVQVRAELQALGHTFTTAGDTEVVAVALDTWGEDALPRLEGQFAVAWTRGDGVLHAARDRFGEVPLHLARVPGGWAVASEIKALNALAGRAVSAQFVGPGEVVAFSADGTPSRRQWYVPPVTPRVIDMEQASVQLRELVRTGSAERAISDVPVCALLSGGVDSAAIVWGLKQVMPQLVCYVAVMDPKSPDVRCARETAEMLDVELREVTITPPTSDDLARVVAAIEMPHKAQVEIGWPCHQLGVRMNRDGFKVTFSGEGSDELWASYGFAYHGLSGGADWHAYRRDLFVTQHRKNFARCNKVFMAHGIECRLPFLHTPLVEFALSLPRAAVQDGTKLKAVMQRAFMGVLPARVTSRQKLAFQKGLGLDKSIATAVAQPERFYRAEFKRSYGDADA